MFLQKRKNGYWNIVYENEKGKRTQKSTKTKNINIAKPIYNKFKEQYLLKDFNLTIEELIIKFLEYQKDYFTKATYLNYMSTLKDFKEFQKNKKIKELTQDDINKYITYAHKKNIASSVNTTTTRIKMLLGFARKNKYINEVFYFQRNRIQQSMKEFLTREECEKLLEYCKNKDLEDIIVVVFSTGLRLCEATTLQWDNIDLKNKTIILHNKTYVTKTKKMRVIPLNDFAYSTIEKRFNMKNNEFVFTYKGKEWSSVTLQCQFKTLVKEIFPNKNLSFHNLRHSFASNAINAGVPIAIVAQILGHVNLTSTMIYTHVATENLRKCVDSVDIKKKQDDINENIGTNISNDIKKKKIDIKMVMQEIEKSKN